VIHRTILHIRQALTDQPPDAELRAILREIDLVWGRGPEPGLAGYEGVWRATDSPDWTHVIPVGNLTRVRVDLSKDNAFFGVRAGHRGPVAFPLPD
jgi:hypothetical protein